MLKYVYRYDSGHRLRAITKFAGLFGYTNRILLKSKWGVRWSAMGVSGRAPGQEACSASRGNGISPGRQIGSSSHLLRPDAGLCPFLSATASFISLFEDWFSCCTGAVAQWLYVVSPFKPPELTAEFICPVTTTRGEQKIGSFGPRGPPAVHAAAVRVVGSPHSLFCQPGQWKMPLRKESRWASEWTLSLR